MQRPRSPRDVLLAGLFAFMLPAAAVVQAAQGPAAEVVGSAVTPVPVDAGVSTPRPPRPPRLQLDAVARSRIPNDQMVVTLAAERSGSDVGELNRQVLEALNSAIARARAKEGVHVRLGQAGTQPVFDDKGRRTGWQVRGEVIVDGTELPKVAELAGALATTLQIAQVQYQLSDATRERERQRLLNEAIDRFGNRAQQAAQRLGYRQYRLHRVTLSGEDGPGSDAPRPVRMARAAMHSAAAAEQLPVEGGESEVTASVRGDVELLDAVGAADGSTAR